MEEGNFQRALASAAALIRKAYLLESSGTWFRLLRFGPDTKRLHWMAGALSAWEDRTMGASKCVPKVCRCDGRLRHWSISAESIASR